MPLAAPSARPASNQLLAVLLLALAMAAAALALWAGPRQTQAQGPWGLAVLPGGQVWLSVDEQLWRLNAQGQRQQVAERTQTQLAGTPGVLMPHPQGHLAVWVRGEDRLHLLAADDARPLGSITLQWPADLARHGRDAIHFALAPDGRVAVATGGGHAVALFDAQGRLLARSAPDTFRFTNGLWWADGSWWTTDTNRPALVRLADADLKVLQRLPLADMPGPWHFPGVAAASHGERIDGQPLLGSVARMANDMERAHVVDVAASGAQRAYPMPEEAGFVRPRALAWLNGQLLLVDGQGFAIRRWSAQRQRLPDFGDAAVLADLGARHAKVQRWRLGYHTGLALAVGLLLAALAVLARQRRRQAQAQLQAISRQETGSAATAWRPELRGQPLPTAGQIATLGWRAAWPFLPLACLGWLLPQWLGYGVRMVQSMLGLPTAWREAAPMALVALSMLSLMGLMLLALRRQQRLLRTDPALEPLANLRALRLLARPQNFWPLRQPGEQVRETLMLNPQGLNTRWLVLTQQRLLVFAVSGFDTRLLHAVPRRDIARVQCLPLSRAPHWWMRLMAWPGVYLRLVLADGATIDGVATSARAAQRLAARGSRLPASAATPAAPPATSAASAALPASAQALGQSAAITPSASSASSTEATEARATQPAESPAERRRTLRQALASLCVPGAGQWAQRRQGTALLLFVVWLLTLLWLAEVLWVAWGGYKEVRPAVLVQALLTWLLVCAAAAADAWRMRAGRADKAEKACLAS